MDLQITSKKDVYQLYHLFEEATHKYRGAPGKISFGSSGTPYGEDIIRTEGFLRLLWGSASAYNSGLDEENFKYYADGILAGTNPTSSEYWGELLDDSQLMVEMASLAFTLMLTKETFWQKLTASQKENIYHWLDQINHYKVPKNNWRFFRLLVNVTFIQLGLSENKSNYAEDLSAIDEMYLDQGWYFDGNAAQRDYYIPWAFHFYGLIFYKFMKDKDPIPAEKFKERAIEFAQSYQYFFDSQTGAAVPFGRSMVYRFAQVAYWSALVFADVEALPWGRIKSLIFNNLRFWTKQKILRADGILNLGYTYENQIMTESYNAPGSPFWAFKAFILLSVPDDHPFWQTEETLETPNHTKHVLKSAEMMITSNAQGANVMLYPVGQFTKQMNGAAKYSKFVYSTLAGFSVQRGTIGLKEGAFDNVLAVRLPETDFFIPKGQDIESYLTDDYLYYKWQPFPGTIIISYVVPLGDWHLRIHQIESSFELEVADSGFAVGLRSSHHSEIKKTEDGATKKVCQSTDAISGAVTFVEAGQAEWLIPSNNTNLLYPNTAVPSIQYQLSIGENILINAFGLTSADKELADINLELVEQSLIVNDKKIDFPGIDFSKTILRRK